MNRRKHGEERRSEADLEGEDGRRREEEEEEMKRKPAAAA
jgi:hypothetical protein